MSVYACSDLHGYLDAYKQIKAFLKPEDKVYFLGDAGDRGPQSWETIKAVATDPQFIYLKGNHEDMLWDACKHILEDYINHDAYNVLCYNGGANTFDAVWNGMPQQDAAGWMGHIRRLPTAEQYLNKDGQLMVLTHAGFTPSYDKGNNLIIPWDEELIWDRGHIHDEYLPKLDKDNVFIVHGHTPIPLLKRKLMDYEPFEPGAYYYYNDHKICIDNGVFATGYVCLFDLDTFDEHIFQVDVEE